MIIAELLTLARLRHLYYINSATWDTTTLKTATCPAGKRWFVLAGIVGRDVAATLSIDWNSVAATPISIIDSWASSTNVVSFPTFQTDKLTFVKNIILDAGDYIRFVFSVAQGATAYVAMSVLEIDMT